MNELLNKIITEKQATVDEAYAVFDSLEPVTDYEFMTGRWKGTEIASGNPWDELLPLSGWYGKVFESSTDVHPLVYYGEDKNELWAVNPASIPLDWVLPKEEYLEGLFLAARPGLETKKSTAQLRKIEYRGKSCVTMAYDQNPIFDHFVKIDENRIFGLMDWKGVPVPYVFLLERDNDAEFKSSFLEE